MPANFLIVCGGAGRGILSRFDELGFNGALQIDVQDRLVQSWNGRVLTFGLPISPAIETPPTTHTCINDYQMRLDYAWQTVHQAQGHDGAYAQCQEEECVTYRRQIQHAAIVRESIADQEFAAGVQRTPLVARAYMTRPLVTRALGEQLQKMLSMRSYATEIVVWIVASTCGGTGNGMVHHVADVVRQVFGFGVMFLKINILRIGSLSYQGVDHLATASTFWSVLTDCEYRHKYQKSVAEIAKTGGILQYRLSFCYLEVTDVGTDSFQRESLVQTAFAAISNPTMDVPLKICLNNSDGVVMVRVGEWSNEFDQDASYMLTLNQLVEKLEYLLSSQDTAQSYARWLFETQSISVSSPTVVTTPEMQQHYTEVAQRPAMQPILKGLQNIKPEVFDGMTNVLQVQQHPKWQEMRQLVSQIFTETEMQNIARQVQVHLTIEGLIVGVNLGHNADEMGPMYIASRDHIGRIQLAQRAKARIKHYLLGDTSTEGCIKTVLRETWNGLIPPSSWGGMFIDNESRLAAFRSGIVIFLIEYFKVARCLALYNEAEQIIQHARKDFSNVTNALHHEIANSANDATLYEYTLCAELDETFGREKTWLQRLVGVASLGEFRHIVEIGANGLTAAGLKHMLHMHNDTNTSQIVEVVNRTTGTNGAVWWQGIERPYMWDGPHGTGYWFDYRYFPMLPEILMEELIQLNQKWADHYYTHSPRYVQSSSLIRGLKVYAVQCVSLTTHQKDEVLELRQLLWSTPHALSQQMSEYIDEDKKQFSVLRYRQVQCSRSVGLPVRIPRELLNDTTFGLNEIVHELEDCITFDMNERRDEI